jgi:hypothetical protein
VKIDSLLCAAPTEHGHHHKMAKRLAEYLDLTDAQKAAYKEFVDARIKAVDDAKTASQRSRHQLGRTPSDFGCSYVCRRSRARQYEVPDPSVGARALSVGPDPDA